MARSGSVDVSDFGVSPVVVVAVHERLDPGTQLLQAGEGVPVVVLVLEDGPKRFRTRVVVTRAGVTHRTH